MNKASTTCLLSVANKDPKHYHNINQLWNEIILDAKKVGNDQKCADLPRILSVSGNLINSLRGVAENDIETILSLSKYLETDNEKYFGNCFLNIWNKFPSLINTQSQLLQTLKYIINNIEDDNIIGDLIKILIFHFKNGNDYLNIFDTEIRSFMKNGNQKIQPFLIEYIDFLIDSFPINPTELLKILSNVIFKCQEKRNKVLIVNIIEKAIGKYPAITKNLSLSYWNSFGVDETNNLILSPDFLELKLRLFKFLFSKMTPKQKLEFEKRAFEILSYENSQLDICLSILLITSFNFDYSHLSPFFNKLLQTSTSKLFLSKESDGTLKKKIAMFNISYQIIKNSNFIDIVLIFKELKQILYIENDELGAFNFEKINI